MGRNLSQMLKLEFENLDKEPKSRTSAMKLLKSLVEDLDSNSIPIFLSQVSETKETESASGEYTISLYEDLARVHGTRIVPHINTIMSTIIITLTNSDSNLDPFGLHQACSKVVSTIARYGMDPTTPDVKKQELMHSISRPLSDSLLSRQECLSSGAAVCLKAVVELDNWRFCSSQTVNEVCQRVTAALERPMNGDSHMGLVMGLVRSNGLVVEGYVRLLVRSGVRILNRVVTEEGFHNRLSAIRMVNCLMRSLDYKSVMSELTFVIEEFQKFEDDEIFDVKEAAFEAVQTAKRLLWSNGDVSLKDGLFSGQMSSCSSGLETEAREEREDGFSGFLHRSPIDGDPRGTTVSTQRSQSFVNADDGCSRNKNRRFRIPTSSKFNRISNLNYDQTGFNQSFTDKDEPFNGTSEMVSSTEDIPTNGSNNLQHCQESVTKPQVKAQIMSDVSIYSGLVILLVAVICYVWIRGIGAGYYLVPT